MESRANAYQGGIFSTWTLATIAVALRFISRYVSASGYWFDDWFMIVAWLLCTANAFMIGIWQVAHGLGEHIADQPDPVYSTMVNFKGLFITEFFFTFTILFVKLSVLAFFWRLFKLQLRIPIIALTVVVVCWAVAVCVTVVVQCIPVQGFWDRSTNPKCNVDEYSFFFGNAIPNTITDCLLLLMPLFPVWKLHMSTIKKLGVSLCFLLGGLVIAVSIYRITILVALLNNHDSTDWTWLYVGPQMWTAIEMSIAVASGCLPLLKPVFGVSIGGLKGLFGSTSTESSSRIKTSSETSQPWVSEKGQTMVSPASVNSTVRGSDEEHQPPVRTGIWSKQSRSASTPQTEEENGSTHGHNDVQVKWR